MVYVMAQCKEAEERQELREANCVETGKETAADGKLWRRVERAYLLAAGKQHSEGRQVN